MQYYGIENKNENLDYLFGGEEIKFHVLNYNLSKDIKVGLNDAFKWWAEILEHGANMNQSFQYFVGTYDVTKPTRNLFRLRTANFLKIKLYSVKLFKTEKLYKLFPI